MTWLLVTRSPLWPSVSALSLIPRHPYSAVPLPSNWELWLNFPDAVQQSPRSKKIDVPNWCCGSDLRSVNGVFCGTAPTFVRWRCAQYDGIVALAACEHFGRSRRVIPMMMVVLMAGIGL